MKEPTLIEGIGVALVTSIAGATGFSVLAVVFTDANVFRLMITLMTLAYVLYLLARSHERVGRVTVVFIWLTVATLNYLFVPSLLLYLVFHIGLIWLVRALYHYQGILPAMADLILTGFGLVSAIWAWSVSQSLLLSFWCFFLVQALFVLIPKQLSGKSGKQEFSSQAEDKFERAHRAAELAVRKMTRLE